MEASGDPVQAAVEERRARRADEHRLGRTLTLADHCRAAAERRLRVRAFLVGGSTVSGTAAAADEALLMIESGGGAGPAGRVRVAISALVRLTVAEPGARRRTPPAIARDAPALVRSLAELAGEGGDLIVVLSDGSSVCGPLVSLGDRTIGFGAAGAAIDWVDPTRIVSVAQVM